MKKFTYRVDKNGFKTTFSDEQDEILKENYLNIPVKRIAKMINKSFTGITSRMKQLDLIIPKELAEERKRSGMFRESKSYSPEGCISSSRLQPRI